MLAEEVMSWLRTHPSGSVPLRFALQSDALFSALNPISHYRTTGVRNQSFLDFINHNCYFTYTTTVLLDKVLLLIQTRHYIFDPIRVTVVLLEHKSDQLTMWSQVTQNAVFLITSGKIIS